MQAIRVRAFLLDGRIAGTESWFPLDSILAAEWIRRNHPDKFYMPPPPGVKEGWIEAPLPLERRGAGNRWYWACSFNQTQPVTEYVTYWHRRFDDNYERYINFGKKRGIVQEQKGLYKAYRMPLNILIFVEPLEWYVVGEIKAVRELCEGIPALGKKPSQGYGLIEHWEVEPWPEDWSEVGPDRRLMRAVYKLPPRVQGVRRRLYGMRPPYYLKENQEEVWVP